MYDDDLTSLEDLLRRLKVEYDIFFNGHRKRPPEDLRLRVERLVKKMSEASEMTYQQRFRYNTLVTRFYLFRDIWRRSQMDQEMGVNSREAPPALISRKTAATGVHKPPPESTMRVAISHPASEEEKVRRLYNFVLGLRQKIASEETSISFQQFVKYISAQTEKIQSQYHCPTVEFQVSVTEESVKFTARAVTSG